MTYQKVVYYEIKATAAAPFRTGPADGNMRDVLRGSDGGFLLQGSSIAGSLREWIEEKDHDTALFLFGTQDDPGRLTVSDGVFFAGVDGLRPRLRIDGKTGAAAGRMKFDLAHIVGGKFWFSLTFFSFQDEDLRHLHILDEALSALDRGEIRFGSQKTNGYGLVRIAVQRKMLDMRETQDREAWLSDEIPLEDYTLPNRTSVNHVTFRIACETPSVLVKAASAENGSRGSALGVNQKEGDNFILPGSSVKGAFRSRCKTICIALGYDQNSADQQVEKLFGSQNAPGKLVFQDAAVIKPKRKSVTRIRINRETGCVASRALLHDQPLSAQVNLEIKAPDDPVTCGLLLLCCRDLDLGLFTIGSGYSVGRGFLTIRDLTIETPVGRFKLDADGSSDGPEGIVESWMTALKGVADERKTNGIGCRN